MKREGEQKIGYIDFGSALVAEESEGLPPMDRFPRSYNHCLLSHWNIEGYRNGKRDDVFKAILTGAHFLNGMEFHDYCVSLETDMEEILDFVAPGMPDRIAELKQASDAERNEIRTGLVNVLALARSPESVSDIPPYAEIFDALRRTLPLVETGDSSTR